MCRGQGCTPNYLTPKPWINRNIPQKSGSIQGKRIIKENEELMGSISTLTFLRQITDVIAGLYKEEWECVSGDWDKDTMLIISRLKTVNMRPRETKNCWGIYYPTVLRGHSRSSEDTSIRSAAHIHLSPQAVSWSHCELSPHRLWKVEVLLPELSRFHHHWYHAL